MLRSQHLSPLKRLTKLKQLYCKVDTSRSLAYVVGYQSFSLLALCYVTSTLGFMASIGISPLHFPICFLLSFGLTWLLFGKKSSVIAAAITLGVIMVTIVFGSWFLDYSVDGQYYHQQMIYSFMAGWNPIYHPIREDLFLWSSHYAHAMELISATISSMMGNIEAGKALNLLLISAGGFLAWGYMRNESRLSTLQAWVVAILVVLNPIAIFQLTTYYIDFASYYFIVLTLIFSLPFASDKVTIAEVVGLTMTIILAVNTKFNAFFYECLTIVAIMGGFMLMKRWKEFKRYFLLTSILVLVAFFIFGYHPYITNWIFYGHPAYPLMGENHVEIMEQFYPENFIGRNRIINFIDAAFWWPEILPVPSYDWGWICFGRFFSVIFIISLALIVAVCIWKRKRLGAYIATVVLLSCFCFPECWWGRYIPQIWLLVPLSYIMAMRLPLPAIKIARGLLVAVVCGSSMIYLCFTLGTGVFFSQFRRIVAHRFEGRELAIAGGMKHESQWLEDQGVVMKTVDLDAQDYLGRINYIHPFGKPTSDVPYLVISAEDQRAIWEEFDSDKYVNMVGDNFLWYTTHRTAAKQFLLSTFAQPDQTAHQ